ncbi:MAG: hypothetical protein V2A79_14830 [Planctomycetota bacterium]
MKVMFRQYMRPDGRQVPIYVDLDSSFADQVQRIRDDGCRLEAEVLTTGVVSFTIYDPSTEDDVACELVENGPGVLAAVERLIHGYTGVEVQP